jgi:hypothetical protein
MSRFLFDENNDHGENLQVYFVRTRHGIGEQSFGADCEGGKGKRKKLHGCNSIL